MPKISFPAVPFRLVLILLLAHISFAGARFSFTLQAVSLNASSLQIGFLLAALMIGPVLLSVAIGRLVDKLGYVPVTAVGLAAVVVGTMVSSLCPVLSALYFASVLVGTGFMAAHVSVQNAIGKTTPESERTEAFSAVAVGYSISGFFAPLVSGAMLQAAGTRATYFMLVGFAISAALMLRHAAPFHLSPPVPIQLDKMERSTDLLKIPQLRAVFATGVLFTMSWDLFNFFAPLQGIHSGLGPAATGAIVSSLSVGTFAVRMLVGRLTKAYGEWSTMAGALVLTAAVFFLFPLLNSFYTLAAAAFLLGMGVGAGQPLSMSLLYKTAPQHRAGEAAGLRSSISSISQTMLPMMFGAVGAAVGLIAVFWSVACLLSAGAWTSIRRITRG